MSTFAVIREAGPGWRAGGIYEQPGVAQHATFMDALADGGFVLLAGPLAGTETGRVRVLLIVNAEDEDEIHRQLADDPLGHDRTARHREDRAVADPLRRNTTHPPGLDPPIETITLTGRAPDDESQMGPLQAITPGPVQAIAAKKSGSAPPRACHSRLERHAQARPDGSRPERHPHTDSGVFRCPS